MKRSLQQVRPKHGDPTAPMYAPQRDLAYIYGPACREAFWGLDQVNWQEYFSGWLEAASVTQDDLGEGVRRFVEAQRLFVHDPDVEEPAHALQKAGFFDVPHPVRIMIYERIGEVMTGGFFVALRDVTPNYDAPPPDVEFDKMLAAGRVMAEVLCGAKRQPGHLEVVLQESREHEERARLAGQALERQRDLAGELRKQLALTTDASEKEIRSLRKQLAAQEKAHNEWFRKAAEFSGVLEAWKGRGLWRRLFNLPPRTTQTP